MTAETAMTINSPEWQEASNAFQEAMNAIEREEEAWWNSLTEDQQISALCCVSRRIHEGDIRQKGSYRYVLYQVFGFGPEAYARAQLAGYLAIHNSIYTSEDERRLLERFAEYNGLPATAVDSWYESELWLLY